MSEFPHILYIDMVPGEPSQRLKLAGIQRYATLRGWDVVCVPRAELRETDVRSVLARYRPVGGQTRIQASVEYSIPLTKWFRLGAFYDIGNVWEDAFDADFSEYASSFGGGFRIDFPGFPLRFDYAMPIEKDDDCTRTQRWVFWVGYE